MRSDLRETENGYILETELPGFSKEDIRISLKDEYLTISVEKEQSHEDVKNQYVRRERYNGRYARSFYVGNVREEDIHARMDKGVLTVTFPKTKDTEQKKYIMIE